MNPNTRNTLFLALLAVGMAAVSPGALAIGGLADIQIVDRAENRRLPVYWHEGRAYVVGKPGNEYQISVRNQAGADVLAVVSVDGVNAVSGETAAPEQTGYVLGHQSSYDIRGWRKSLSRTAAFYFTELPDSYAARTGRPDNVGVIGVAVYRRKQAEPPVAVGRIDLGRMDSNESRESRPRSMQDSARDAAGSAAGSGAGTARLEQPAAAPPGASAELSRRMPAPEKSLGTGHGRNETSVVRNVAFERATPYPEEVITIYYDSQRNLMARGVIPPAPVAQPRPQPFPGRFVQDPPRG
jgi:hypothetical protein